MMIALLTALAGSILGPATPELEGFPIDCTRILLQGQDSKKITKKLKLGKAITEISFITGIGKVELVQASGDSLVVEATVTARKPRTPVSGEFDKHVEISEEKGSRLVFTSRYHFPEQTPVEDR